MLTNLEPINEALSFARARFTYGLQCVPEDRRNWSPGGSAPTAMAIGGKVAGFLTFLGTALQQGAMPARPEGGLPPTPDNLDDLIAAVNAGFDALQAGVSSLDEKDPNVTMRAPWGQELSLVAWVGFACQVVGYFQGQLNLLQLAYGDETPNIPPPYLQQ